MSSGRATTGAAAARFATDVAALRERAAVVSGRHSVIWVRGADTVTFLDALVSQSVAGTGPGAVKRSLLLTPQGKMRALLWILGGSEDELGLVTQRSTEAIVVEDLNRFRFRVDATIEIEPRPVATLVGPGAATALAAADIARPGGGWLPTAAGLVANVPFVTGQLPRFVVVGDVVAALTGSAPPAGDLAYQAVRILMGEPEGVVDFDDGTISHELGPVDAAVDFTKGCYLGQELVARIDSRGRVNRTLRRVRAAGAIDLAGVALSTNERAVGTVTSAAPDPDGNGTIGLALVRREVENGSQLTAQLDGTTTTVTVESIATDPPSAD